MSMQSRFRLILNIITLGFGLLSTVGAYAALQSVLGGQAINDTDLNITWLQNPNLASSNTFGVTGILSGGLMDWYTTQRWIGAMNSANYLGYSDWRLPTTPPVDAACSYNCSGNEMGHLFYTELGGQAGSIINVTHNANFGLFSQDMSHGYWSGSSATVDTAFVFYFGYWSAFAGTLSSAYKPGNIFNAWPVRTGQIVATPLPTAVWLFGSGLLGLVGFARKRKIV